MNISLLGYPQNVIKQALQKVSNTFSNLPVLLLQVETLGDAVYMVAGGVPDRSPDHAINVAGLALELQEKAQTLVEPWFKDYKLNTRIGKLCCI